MNNLRLVRLERSESSGTFGVLSYNDEIVCLTLELPWRENRVGESCIPEGVYRIVRRQSWSRTHDLGHTFEVIVPKRTSIIIHPANLVSELEGCIATGYAIGPLNGKRALLNSKLAFRRLMKIMWTVNEARLTVLSLHLSA